MRYVIVLVVAFLAIPVWADNKPYERDYAKAWCTEGALEYVLPDYTRVDCLTDEYAIEFDYGKKWAEAVGQALYYAASTNRKPGIVLIVRPGDERYIRRLETLASRYGIKVWLMKVVERREQLAAPY